MIKQNVLLVAFTLVAILFSSCGDPSNGKSGGSAAVTRSAIEYYLGEEKLNSPGVAVEVAAALNNGQEYKKVIKDENKKTTTLRAWIDRKDRTLFCITYYRDMICPKCHGTGFLTLPSKLQNALQSKIKTTNIGISCNQCHGKGHLDKVLQKKCWILGVADYKDPQTAIALEEANTLQTAPANTQTYIDNLASTDPATRLAACEWLNTNYIKPGLRLIEISPILDRARFVSPIEDKSIMRKIMGKASGQHEFSVYQFWAGKGEPSLANKTYYRIYVDSTAGEVIKTAFVQGKSARQRRTR